VSGGVGGDGLTFNQACSIYVHMTDSKKLAFGWIRIEEIEGRNHAPGSGYRFMENWDKPQS
jgi:hypothetical protein